MAGSVTDLSYGTDVRGDYALFIAETHFTDDWTLDVNVGELTFIRVINANGDQTPSHGWAEGTKVVQWG